jgi:phage baseplate assembly protein gpV
MFYADDLANFVKMHSAKQDQSYGFLRAVQVKEYDPKKNRVKVGFASAETQEYSIISNWLPWYTPSNGQGVDAESGELWGMVFTPCIGEWAYQIPLGGDPNGGIIVGGVYTDTRPPPTIDGKYTVAGEWLWKHRSGSYLKFHDNGDITLFAKGNLNFHAGKNMNTHVVGDITTGAEGTVSEVGTSIMLSANADILLNAPEVDTTQNLAAGNGASGTFQSTTGQTITVVDGIIVNIYDVF